MIGTPAYGAGVSPATQRLMAHLEQRRQVHPEQPLAGKVAAAVVDARNARSQHSLAVLTRWFRANGMVVADGAGGTRRRDGAPTGRAADEADAAMARIGRAVAATLRRLRA